MKALIAATTTAVSLVVASSPAAEPDYCAEIELHVVDPCLMSFALRTARTDRSMPLEEALRLAKALNRAHVERLVEVTLPTVRGLSRDARLAIYDFARNECVTGASHAARGFGTQLPRRPRRCERDRRGHKPVAAAAMRISRSSSGVSFPSPVRPEAA